MELSTSLKRIFVLLISISFLFPSNLIFAGGGPSGQKPVLKAPYFEPSSFSKSQKKLTQVQGIGVTNIGVYIYQLDNLSWRVDGECNDKRLANNPSTNKPVSSTVCIDLDLNAPEYIPPNYLDSNGDPHSKDEFISSSLHPVYMDDVKHYTNGDPILVSVESFTGTRIKFTTQIGGSIEPFAYRPYHGDKYSADYKFKTDLYWTALSEITKEINLSSGGQLSKGQTKQLNATVKTKIGDGSFGQETNVNTGNGKTTWESSNPGVATVSSSGLVTAVNEGTTNITVKWEKDGYKLTTTTTIGVDVDPGSPPGGGGACTLVIGSPTQGTKMSMSDMDPNAKGVIRADNRDAERFDVLQGIPTSESLFTNVSADNYLFKHIWVQLRGKTTYNCSVDVTYARQWTESGPPICTKSGCVPGPPISKSDTQTKNYTFSFTRDYSYWQINNLEVYKINRAEMSNYALPDGTVTMIPAGYTPPTLDSKHDEPVDVHVKPAITPPISYTPPILTGGLNSPPPLPDDTSLLKGMAESSTPESKVKNDMVNFNGSTIMDSAEVIKNGPTPKNIPNPTTIGRDVLYSPGNLISSSKVNKKDTPSSGKIAYDLMAGNINGGENKEFPIHGINTVTVHTPVINYSSVSDDKAHNQKTNPNYSRSALILERPFQVRIPTNGQHVNYPGYGNRDYAKYFRTKQVLFPFDVYNENKTRFIPKNTWIDIPVNQLDTAFFLPVWVDEGDYQVYFRNIAENSPNDYENQGEQDANRNLIHHAATDEVSVEVIGRLYDFHITDIADYNWQNVFRTQSGSANPTGVSYWVGQKLIDGDPRGNKEIYTLTIRPGSHPLRGYKNVSVKTGYHFKFDFKTKGNMFGPLDGIRIMPSFYFVSKDGKPVNARGDTRVPVDLYYNNNKSNFIKVGSAQDQVQRYVILNERLRNVPAVELTDTASYKYNHYGQTGGLNKNQFIQNYLNVFTKQKTPVGSYSLLILPEQLRTFLRLQENIPGPVDPERANVSIQKWYGEYSLPAEPFVVLAGTNVAEYGRTHGGLNSKSPIFLKNGYIVVNFNIESIQAGNLKNPHLQYINAPLMNQWELEGYRRNIQDSFGTRFHLRDGDVVFYNADRSSRDDFSSQVPH